MAHLLRLIIAIALLGAAAISSAAVPMVVKWYASSNGPRFDTPDAACRSVAGSYAFKYSESLGEDEVRWGCRGTLAPSTTPDRYAFVYGEGACPPGSSLVDGVCQCAAATPQVGGSCSGAGTDKSDLEEFCESHAAPKNTFNQKGTVSVTSPTPQSSCYKPYPPFPGADATKGCTMTLRDIVKVPGDDGLMNWSATGIPTGATCEDAAATDNGPKAGPDKCPSGFPGTVNGTEVCVPVEPDKGIEGTKTTSSTAANGTKTDITEVTKCQGTVCTTTTTTKTTTSAGAVTSSSTSVTQSLADKCVKDPANKVCTKTGTTGGGGGGKGDGEDGPSSFDGSCASGFKAVSDDAVLNAMAEEQYRRNCELLRTDSEASTWLQGESQKTGDRTGDLAGNKDVSISGADIDTSDALGGGGCNLDKTITVAKMTVTLPFGKVCEPLEVFGQLLVAVSMLLAGRIIMRG